MVKTVISALDRRVQSEFKVARAMRDVLSKQCGVVALFLAKSPSCIRIPEIRVYPIVE